MKNKKKVVFIVDVKDRDLEGLKRIGIYLKDLNYKSIYLPSNVESKTVIQQNPEAIIIPKANFNKPLLSLCKLNGIKIIVIDTEGNPQDKNYKLNIPIEPNLYLFWNKSYSERYKNFLLCKKEPLYTVNTSMLHTKKG